MKIYKTKINKKIFRLADCFGLEIIVADSLKDSKIDWLPEEANENLALYTNGIIFLKSYTFYNNDDFNLVALHEIGHAIIQHHKIKGFKIDKKSEEISANCIAFSLAAILDLQVSEYMIEQFNQYNNIEFNISNIF